MSSRMRKVVKVVGCSLLVLALLAGTGLFVAAKKAEASLARRIEAHRVEIPVPMPLSEKELAELGAAEAGATAMAEKVALERAVARGKHLVEARYGCAACHGHDLAGGVMLDDPAIGTLLGPNLTSGKGGLPGSYSMTDWDRIVRHGIKRDGSPSVMPSQDFVAMSDAELSDIVAYVRSRPPVDAEVGRSSLGPVGNVLLALGKLPLSADMIADHRAQHAQSAPVAADSAEFGAHLAATCTGCHRENLAGGPMPFGPPSWPAAANLTQDGSGLAGWTFEDFDAALTRGLSKGGRALREPMTHVLDGTRAMTPLERKALWTYLRGLKPTPTNS